jgi:DNA-directed RNA polymerase alpha subunit
MTIRRLVLIGAVCFITGAGALVQSTFANPQEMGAEEMVLEGGKAGTVPFPHRRHQEALKEDCQVCHELFPQQKGSIEALKAEGKLESKQVMNRLCTSCHRQYRRQGINAGPTTCSKCHER